MQNYKYLKNYLMLQKWRNFRSYLGLIIFTIDSKNLRSLYESIY